MGTISNVKEIRHVYLDVDENAKAVLASVRNSEDTPPPNFINDTSPGKFQVVWNIEGADIEQAESLLHSLASHFGSDKAATDATRVLRMPGFVNRKYPNEGEFVVKAQPPVLTQHRSHPHGNGFADQQGASAHAEGPVGHR